MTSISAGFVEAATMALTLVGAPEVARRWDEPSALEGMTVGDVAAHLARQVFRVPEVLAVPVPDERPVGVVDHYERSEWATTGFDDEANVEIREHAAENAAIGPAQVLRRAQEMLVQVEATLPGEPLDRLVRPPWTGWNLTLEDYLRTRLLEIVIHSDDLAVSADVEPPQWPQHVVAPVLGLLTTLAVRKHGAPAVLRTLSRRERAPKTIAAF